MMFYAIEYLKIKLLSWVMWRKEIEDPFDLDFPELDKYPSVNLTDVEALDSNLVELK